MTRLSQLWNYIEIWGFREDIKDVKGIDDDANEKDGNDDKGISALGLDRDLRLLLGNKKIYYLESLLWQSMDSPDKYPD